MFFCTAENQTMEIDYVDDSGFGFDSLDLIYDDVLLIQNEIEL